jgi:A/G-specific adenine glycosylase
MNKLEHFQQFIWDFYNNNGREFAWRHIENPYYVLVSEIMLQQTQTHRVITKYEEFLLAFPTIQSLAFASLRDVLLVWQGLGYYRRARYLHQIATIVVAEYDGIIPADPIILQTFPGLGTATASSICAFAFNMPTVFIETNIRTVFIHSFFQGQSEIKDKELMPLIAATVDQNNPREWYYALMDYGVYLKNQYTNPSRKSAHYNKQSKFEGSDRQIRASILKLITTKSIVHEADIFQAINKEKDRVARVLSALESEQFIRKDSHSVYMIV